MCGLFGMMGDLEHKDEAILKEGLVVCSIRGDDSTGIIKVNKRDTGFETVKQIGPPTELFNVPRFRSLSMYTASAMIGHCRKATVGRISRFTAHPFEADHIVGVHNGTLMNWRSVFKDTLKEDYEVDSAALFASIAEYGARDTFSALTGAWACVWYDSDEDTLNFLRNEDRPLWWCKTEDGKKIYWASEWQMLDLVLTRNGVKIMKDEEGRRFHLVAANKWFKWRWNDNKLTLVGEPIELKGKETVAYNNNNRTPFSWEGNRHTPKQPSRVEEKKEVVLVDPDDPDNPLVSLVPNPEESTTTSGPSDNSKSQDKTSQSGRQKKTLLSLPRNSNVVSFERSTNTSDKSGSSNSPSKINELNDKLSDLFQNEVLGYNGRFLTRGEFDKCAKHGCAWCQKDLEFNSAMSEIAYWVSDEGPVCKDCSTSPELNSFLYA